MGDGGRGPELEDHQTGLRVASVSSCPRSKCKSLGHNHQLKLETWLFILVECPTTYVALYGRRHGVDDVEHVRHPTRHASVQNNLCRFNNCRVEKATQDRIGDHCESV